MTAFTIDHIAVASTMVGTNLLTDEILQSVLSKLQMIDPSVSEETLIAVKKHLESTVGIRMNAGQGLRQHHDRTPWFTDTKGSLKLTYWNSYKKMLTATGLPQKVIAVLDEDTDNILNDCGNPNSATSWRVRGLVMGDVQSGKTASYNGLIAKAADAGYKVIVLLTGMIEDLRKQTQERLDAGFVGQSSRDALSDEKGTNRIGAGLYRNNLANVLTSVDFDFLTSNTKALSNVPLANIREPVLFVMKKNKTPLSNLKKWLEKQAKLGQGLESVPLFLLDDEADNASVNTKKEEEDPATINGLIRDLLTIFPKATYTAYTATPFANVFINSSDSTDLFPSDFIYALNTPTTYIGASSIFSPSGEHHHQLRSIEDVGDAFPYKHPKDHSVTHIPESLKAAIRTFFISCAIRDLRGEKLKHRSMLVNVSHLTDVQGQLADLLKEYVWLLQEEVSQFLLIDSWNSHNILSELFNTWNSEYSELEFSWDQIRSTLHESSASVKVITVNQKASDEEKLNYSQFKGEKGRRVIAVGGISLSRGLTLEGLCISYFYRSSKAYDTLLQMGRWFGYRAGYSDIFRIWMDPDAQDWYAHIANAVGELRRDFKRMAANRLRPEQFGIKVLSHPDTLLVTAATKMRSSEEVEFSLSFSCLGTETAYLPRSTKANSQNVDCIAAFIQKIGPAKRDGNRFLWESVEKSQVSDLIEQLNISPKNSHFIPDPESQSIPFIEYIRESKNTALDQWTVCVTQGEGSGAKTLMVQCLNESTPVKVKCRKRQFEFTPHTANYFKLNKQRVGEAIDETAGMSKLEIEAAKNDWEHLAIDNPKQGKSISGSQFRRFRNSPLLMIHFIEPSEPSPDSKNERQMMKVADIGTNCLPAIGISLPDFDPYAKEEKKVYRLNYVAIKEYFDIDENADENDD